MVTVKTPPGTSGRADVTLTVSGKSDTLSKVFQYARTVKRFPFSSSPNFLLFDSGRQKLYAAHKDQVEVIDPITQQVLTPIVPASGKLANSQFAGLSLSPDGNRLYIADAGANLIHELDLTHPGTGASVNPTTAVGSTVSVTPGRVFETSTGTLVGSDVGGNLFTLNGVTGSGSWLTDQFGRRVNGNPWNSTNKGKYIFVARAGNGLISSNIALWNASTSDLLLSTNETQWIVEASADEDGTVIVAGGSTPGISDSTASVSLCSILMRRCQPARQAFFCIPAGPCCTRRGRVPLVVLSRLMMSIWHNLRQILLSPSPLLPPIRHSPTIC